MTKLSNIQLEIIESPIDQSIQVLASAGSGKTRVLTERVRYLFKKTKIDGIIALTFTNKAAEEMRARLSDLEEVKRRIWIATIHTVAQRILKQYGYTIGLPSELHIYERDEDRKIIFLQSLRENGIDIDSVLKEKQGSTIPYYMEQFALAKKELLTEQEIKEKHREDNKFWRYFQVYQSALLESGGIDFDDILVYAHRILLDQPWCGEIYRASFKHICVDEAQDLNKAQYEFIKVFCAEQITSIMMVGDPHQRIYGFNGSSSQYLCERFPSDFKANKFKLTENYRSSKAVIRLANKLKPEAGIESEFALEGHSEIQKQEDESTEAQWIFDKINELIKMKRHPDIEGEISLKKMVVIARNRFVFKFLQTLLGKNKIPYSLQRGENQVEPSSHLGKIIDLGIRLRLNPRDWVDGKKLCEVLKIDAPDVWGSNELLESFAEKARFSDIPFPEIQLNLIKAISRLDLEKPNIPKLCADFKNSIKLLGESGDEGELERSIQELIAFENFWTAFRRKGLGDSLSSFRNAMVLGQLSEEYNPSGLTLSTVHTMKGLEKDIVFLMGMCEGIFPDYRAHSEQEVEEERNNAFVAITRSKRLIYVTYPMKREMPWSEVKIQKISRFIEKMQSSKN